ncbi:MAG: CaiB/BaiF CoA transferase family protein [Myxococcota bacterium]
MLEGYRVLDLSGEPGFLAGKILGDMGADVIKIEPPGGHPDRRPPYLAGIEDPERSLLWLALNTSKRGITLNLGDERGRELFQRLVAGADVVLESEPAGALESLGVGPEALRRSRPELVYTAITPFGQTGPWARYRAHDLVAVALGGNALTTGHPDRPPVRCSMPAAYFHVGPEAALATALALWARVNTGEGQLVDVSLTETQLQTLLSAPAQFAFHGRPTRRSGDRLGGTREIWETRDGYVSFGLRGGPARVANLRATAQYMAECGMAPEWLERYDWESYNHNTLSEEEVARLEEAFATFFRTRTMRELYEEAVKRRIMLAPCNDAQELIEHPQLRAREFFVKLEYPEFDAVIEHPAFFGRSSQGDIRIRRRAPRIGEHNAEVYGELGVETGELQALAADGVI